MKDERISLLELLKILGCPFIWVKTLSPKQLEAILAYKLRVIEATEELYKVLPPEQGDPALGRIMKTLTRGLRERGYDGGR